MNELINRAYESAKSKGFHDKSQQLLRAIPFNDSKEYNSLVKYLNEVEITKDIALVITELAEAIEHVRKIGITNDKQNWKESLPEELADAVIRIFDLCGKYDIDLPYFIEEKMAYNENRPSLHGKRF